MNKKTKVKVGYVDGFVLVVPADRVAAYKRMAKDAGKIWMKYGALEYFECQGDDLENADMLSNGVLTFTKLAKAKGGETVWFSYITYKSKTHRNQVNKKVHAEMEKMSEEYKDFEMPFDMKRVSFGGFKVAVSY